MSAVAKPSQGPLAAALAQAVAAPYRTSRPADAGVIEIERARGDFARGYGAAVHGLSGSFVRFNRGRQSLVADPKDPADAALTRGEVAGPLRRAGTAYDSVNGAAEFAVHPASRRVEAGTPGGAARVAAPQAPVDGAAPALGPVPGVGEHTRIIRRGFREGRR